MRKKDVSNPIQTLGARDYFGGIALQYNQANHASVIAQGYIECVEMKKSFFKESVEPMLNIMKERSAQYRSFVRRLV